MSGSSEKIWSNNPNAPQISYELYTVEKCFLVGTFVSAIFYGTVILLFFQCMGALLDPINRMRGGIKWALVAHTVAMFSALTSGAAMGLNLDPIVYINNREFPGTTLFAPGPIGYQRLIYSDAISVVPNALAFFNTWLADGFLLYRCYVIYSMNYWVIIVPCLMYLASLAFSIALIYYQTSKVAGTLAWNSIVAHFEVPYFSVSLSLNILLTLMIAARLIRHRTNIRNAMGPTTESGLYNTVVAMLVESCAIYAVDSLLLLGSIGAVSPVEDAFAPSFGPIQVIGSFLIVLRVANRTALTSETVTSGNIASIRFKTQAETAYDNGTFPDENPVSSIETGGGVLNERGTRVENVNDTGGSVR